jgi:hypothetical protein
VGEITAAARLRSGRSKTLYPTRYWWDADGARGLA